MSDASNSGGRAKASRPDAGVLANLPRTRPQRSSPRRAAARKAASVPTEAKAKVPAKAPASAKARKPSANAKPAGAQAANAKPAGAKPAKAPAATAKANKAAKAQSAKRKRATAAVSRADAVPRQGFEADGEIATGPVQPPGAAEFVSSAAELAGELAKAGVSGGARLLKEIFARLPPG